VVKRWLTEGQLLPSRSERSEQGNQSIDLDELLRRVAASMGRPFEEVKAQFQATCGPKPDPHLSQEERRAARERLRRHAGALNSGDPHSADNERIDADLAREYGSTHEDED
jgi:hypothetical protein